MNLTLLAILLLIFLSGLFSASEIALTSLSRAQVLALKDDGKFASKAISKLKNTPQRLLISVLVGNQVVNVLATFLATMWSISLFSEERISIVIFFFTLTLILFGSILPKAFALAFSEIFSRIAAYPLLAFVTIVRPVIWIFEMMIAGVRRLFKIQKHPFGEVSEQEIEAMIDIGREEGAIEEEQDLFLKHVLRFGKTKVEEVMTQMKDVIALDRNADRDEILSILETHGHTQFPVYEEDVTNIKGVITLRDVLHHLKNQRKKHPLKDARLSQMIVIPKTATFIQLFKILSEKNRHMAMVIDQFGQTIGQITMADIMEEITGLKTHVDEKPQPVFKKIRGNLWEADGEIRVQQINETLEVKLPYPDHQVLSLVILEELKRFPEVDEVVVLDGLEIKIKRMEKNVVKKLEIKKRNVQKNDQ